MKTRYALVLVALAAALPAAHAQTGKWPEKPVRLIVPVPPGGGIDMVARIAAPRLSEELGQQFIVDNRAGAGGTMGTEVVVRANPDGYTLLIYGSSYAANSSLYKLPYDPVNGIAPIGMIAAGAYVLAVHPSVKATNLKEFLELARAQPGALNFGSAGTGSIPHLAAELLRQLTKTEVTHVPYKGVGPAMTDLLSGRIQFYVGGALAMLPQIRAGKLRGIAVTSEQRLPVAPDLPAIGELVPGYQAILYYGAWAPAGTPKEIISRLNQAFARMLKHPEVLERLRADGVEPAHSTPEEYGRIVARDIGTWSRVVKVGNIKID